MDEKAPKQASRMIIDGLERDLSAVLIFTDGDRKLYKQDLTIRMSGGNVVATPVPNSNEVIIDSRAYDLLEKKCGKDLTKLHTYLKAIINFELKYSNNVERHQNRSPIEE